MTVFRSRTPWFVAFAAASLLLAACGDEETVVADGDTGASDAGTDTAESDSTESATFALVGDWTDSFGGTHSITVDLWDQGFASFHIDSFDNATHVVIAQNDSANEFSPDLWSRFDWTEFDGGLWFCQTVYDGESAEAASAATPADPADPMNAGCSGFGWTGLIAAEQ